MSLPPLAREHWVARDPRTVTLAAAPEWSRLLLDHLAHYDLIELVHGAVVLARAGFLELEARSLAELASLARAALESHERDRELAADERPISEAEQAFLMALSQHGAAVDSGLGVLGACLRSSRLTPSDKLYPFGLIRGLVAAAFDPPRGNPYTRAIIERVRARTPEAWQAVLDALTPIATPPDGPAGWPDPADSARAARALAAIEPTWEVEALVIRERARRLSPKLSSGHRRDLERALQWCVSARHTLTRSSSRHGWLRLLLDYLLEVRSGAARIIAEARPDAPTSTFVDIVMHELAHALTATDSDPSATAQALLDRHSGGAAARMRLSRGRERCLARWTHVEPDPDWDDGDFARLLDELRFMLSRDGLRA